MDEARLIVPRPDGPRTVPLARFPFRLGRHPESDVVLTENDVSRHHAEIVHEGERYVLADSNSRFGTFLNGARIERQPLVHGDHIQLGSANHPALEFQLVTAQMTTGVHPVAQAEAVAAPRPRGTMGLLGQALRAMVDGRVLEEVLAIVVDQAIDLSGAERGFVLLVNPEGELDVEMARDRKHRTLPGRDFQLSHSVPRQVCDTGKLVYENQLPDSRHTVLEFKIRSILCAPLPRIRTAEFETGDAAAQLAARRLLYVDSHGIGQLDSLELHAAFEQLAIEAAVAIDNAHLVREVAEKVRLDSENAVAAEIQKRLQPPPRYTSATIQLAAVMIPCRAIGGDFYEYAELSDGRLGFALCDVSGKGPAAALLAAAIQGMLASSDEAFLSPADAMARLNRTLLRRNVESRFATIAYGMLDASGRLRLTSAGHNPAYLLSADGALTKLHKGGLMVGAFPGLSYEEDELVLKRGDQVVLYSDGVTEAEDASNAQFEEARLERCLRGAATLPPDELVAEVLDQVRTFAAGHAQADDITVLVVRYLGG